MLNGESPNAIKLKWFGSPAAKLSPVSVFRGRPNAHLEPNQHRRCVARAENWRNSGAFFDPRDLKYKFEPDAEGKELTDVYGKRNSPVNLRKSVDVLCTLKCITEAMSDDIGIVITASQDTDLITELDQIYDMHRTGVSVEQNETFTWYDRNGAKNCE